MLRFICDRWFWYNFNAKDITSKCFDDSILTSSNVAKNFLNVRHGCNMNIGVVIPIRICLSRLGDMYSINLYEMEYYIDHAINLTKSCINKTTFNHMDITCDYLWPGPNDHDFVMRGYLDDINPSFWSLCQLGYKHEMDNPFAKVLYIFCEDW